MSAENYCQKFGYEQAGLLKSELTVDHGHENHLVGKTIRDHGQKRDDPRDGGPRRPAQPKQRYNKTRPANARQRQAEVLGVFVWVPFNKGLSHTIVEVSENVGDQSAGKHHHECKTRFTSREAIDSLENIWEDFQEHVEHSIDKRHVDTRQGDEHLRAE